MPMTNCTEPTEMVPFLLLTLSLLNAGGGYYSEDRTFDFWEYSPAQRRQHIHVLEADAVLRAARALAPRWHKKKVPFYIDNSSFQLSFKKGRSKSRELNTVLRELFWISCKYNCVFVPRWISTHDNILADALSRGQLQRFFTAANLVSPSSQCLQRGSQ